MVSWRPRRSLVARGERQLHPGSAVAADKKAPDFAPLSPGYEEAGLRLLTKHGVAQSRCPGEAFLGEHDRVRLVHRVLDQPFVAEPRQGVPVDAFPGAPAVVQREGENRQNGVVDLVGVECHEGSPRLAIDVV